MNKLIGKLYRNVTPFAGVWIEIGHYMGYGYQGASLPSRECGLKLLPALTSLLYSGHSLRGSVD
mgnify:CR=1 FL=1